MATDFFIKIDGVDGESNDKGHSKWIEVIQFSHGAMQNITLSRGADVSGRGQFLPFVFVHALDKATPKLQQFCMNGQKVPKVEFNVCRAIAGAQTVVYEVKMENVKIGKAEVSTVEYGSDDRKSYQPVETVELIAAKISWKVTPIKADNSKDGAVETNFNQIENA